jgi:cobalt transporter subunit CbtA
MTLAHEQDEWGPADGIERAAYTVLANLVVGFAVSLMLLGAMAIKGDPIDARRGLLWGVGGFAAVSLLPALGLPPELPGTPAADITDRQLWWLATAAASAVGIALLAFGRNWGLIAAGVALLVAPHVVGAPLPPSHDVSYPGALAGEFVVASMVASAVLWSLSGFAAGWLHQRLSQGG